MKTRKKTRLCFHCNGVNPLSASHCAYCGAILQELNPDQDEFESRDFGNHEPDMFETEQSFVQVKHSTDSSQDEMEAILHGRPQSIKAEKEPENFAADFPRMSNNPSDLNAESAKQTSTQQNLSDSHQKNRQLSERSPQQRPPMNEMQENFSSGFSFKEGEIETKSLYSVYDQPNIEQMGYLKEELSASSTQKTEQSPAKKSIDEKPSGQSLLAMLTEKYQQLSSYIRGIFSLKKKQSPVKASHYLKVSGLALFWSGQIALIWGIMLLAFSSEGILTLRWPASDWPYFILAGFIILQVGYKLFTKEDPK